VTIVGTGLLLTKTVRGARFARRPLDNVFLRPRFDFGFPGQGFAEAFTDLPTLHL
jgi:hypothetical protein